MKNRVYEELERVFDKINKYYMIFFPDFNAKVGKEDIFRATTGNESLHEISNDNGVRVATSKNLIVKSTKIPHRIFINLLGHFLLERLTIEWPSFDG
jgi:hypothetical protein